jgi:hypothetical protein
LIFVNGLKETMIRQAKTSRRREFIGTTVPVVLRGTVVFLLFTHQAWANIVCCGANEIEPQQSYHQIIEDRDSAVGLTADSGHCHTAVFAEKEQPGVNWQVIRFTYPPEELPWCCQATVVAEPQPPILSSNEQQPIDATHVFFALTPFVASSDTGAHSPPPKSRPIFLTTSCFLI